MPTDFAALPKPKKGYTKRRQVVHRDGLLPVSHIAEAVCPVCKQPIGYDTLYVRHYALMHLTCWQSAYPAQAAEDAQTRGE